MSKFKNGDKVRCTSSDADDVGSISVGQELIVRTVGELFFAADGRRGCLSVAHFELITDTPRPDQLQWLKARIEEGYGDTGYNAALMDVLRIFHGIATTPTTVTRIEWTFSPVQP